MIYAGYGLLLSLFTVYSYALVDPNFTPINTVAWEVFRNWIIPLGYYNRQLSFIFFAILIAGLFGYQYLWMLKKKVSVYKIAIIVAVCTLFAFPFLSHDFFNYMFDAKMFTFYHVNPYTHSALDFPQDSWVRFMHWTHRTYPYGPAFLGISMIPSYISFGKLILNLLFFKILWGVLFVSAIYYLEKHDKKAALFIATSPLIIIEGLVNNHNDFIAVALALLALSIGIIYKKRAYSFLLMISSILIKYSSLPFIILLIPGQIAAYASVVAFAVLMIYVKVAMGLQPWYFLNAFIAVPRLKTLQLPLTVLSIFLLLSYYPYILFGAWVQKTIDMRDNCILAGVIVFVILAINSIWKTKSKFPPWNRL